MAINLVKALGIHPTALLLREKRASLLASNIANADTPGYKAKDLDFKKTLGALTSRAGSMESDSTLAEEYIRYRVPYQPDTGDGNTVDMQQEKMAFAQNSLDYQLSLKIIDGRIKGLIKAIRGE